MTDSTREWVRELASKGIRTSAGKRFRPYQPRQTMLLPPALDDWLLRNHPVYEVVDQLDLSPSMPRTGGRGGTRPTTRA